MLYTIDLNRKRMNTSFDTFLFYLNHIKKWYESCMSGKHGATTQTSRIDEKVQI